MEKTPAGVLVLGALALFQGVIAVFNGIVFLGVVAFGPAVVGDGIVLAGSVAVLVGLAYLVVAFGAWMLQPWAWIVGEIVAMFGIVEAILVALASDSLVWGFSAALFPIIVLWYLNQAHIKEAFGVER